MSYDEKIAEHTVRFEAVLLPGETIALKFYGIYNVKGLQFGGNPDLTGTWAATDTRLLFTGKAKFSSGWSGFAKSGDVITIPYDQIVDFYIKKHKMRIIHTAEHEGAKPGKTRTVTMMPHRLKEIDGQKKKESDKEWIARAGEIFNQLKKFMGRP